MPDRAPFLEAASVGAQVIQHRVVLICGSVGAVALVWLALAMPAEGFYSGDSGVKLIAVFNALRHPNRPLEIDLPQVAGHPQSEYLERFFQVHGDHAHPIQSPLFPLLSAPLIAAFGVRGAYILPAVSFLCLLPLLALLHRQLNLSAPLWLTCLFALAVNPLFFYGLEFWEHAPAVCALAASTVIALSSHRAMVMAGSGVISAVAILLRPEAFWYVVGLCVVLRQRGAASRQLVSFLVGLGVGLLPLVGFNYRHFGSLVGPHVSVSLAPLGESWLPLRVHRLALWLVPSSTFGTIGAVLLALAWAGGAFRSVSSLRELLAVIGGVLVAIDGATGGLARESLWNGWPAGVLALVPIGIGSGCARRALWTLIAASVGGVLLTAAHDGGAQWGPRFLLIAAPPLVLLAAEKTAALWREHQERQRLIVVLVIVVVACGLAATRRAYRDLRGAKRYYARIVDATARLAPMRRYVVTDLWWFDQITATLYPRQTVLYAEGFERIAMASRTLQSFGIQSFLLVISRSESTMNPQRLPGCQVVSTHEITERELTFAELSCSGD